MRIGQFRWMVVVGAICLTAAALTAASCFKPRKLSPTQLVNSMRLQYRISASWFEVKKGSDGTPELVMRLSAANTGRKRLQHVTMLLKIKDAEGKERIRQPLILDVSMILPGKNAILEPVIKGIEVFDGEDLSLQMEDPPPVEAAKTYPEYNEPLVEGAR